MVRLARVVAPGIPHHITQRGNRRQQTFFCAEDYQAYLALMEEWCRSCAVEVWTYCLMPNHVHVIAVPMAARYIEQNPVRAGLAARPWKYLWSSASAHVAGRDDALVKAAPLL
jgi:putative transposase